MKTPIEVQSPKPTVQSMATCSIGNAARARRLQLSMSVRLLLALALSVSLTGCFGFLKPAKATARHFVLSSLPAAAPAAPPGGAVAVGVGVGQIKLATYLFNTSFAVRKGTNEIDYLPATFWAERLDSGLQRVLAANLATLLPTDQIRLSAWQNSDVSSEVYVAVEQFDVDARGQGVIAAWWRILSPGGEKTLKAGECRLVRQGPPPYTNPSGAVATLSELAADLSRQVAQAVNETTSSSGRTR
ncbi:MAG: ABC-type transport auxiliary lipoprotein family protein [Verrucomicrobiota bacterium]